MGNAIYPSLPGLKIEVEKTPRFKTRIQTAVSGRELRASFTSAPKWSIRLAYEFLREGLGDTELQTLLGFFRARRGSWDSFLWMDPVDYQVTNELIGTGDGVTTAFQLVRTWGGVTEPVANVASILVGPLMWHHDSSTPMWLGDDAPMWSAGVDYSAEDFTLSPTGLVTFNTAPAVGEPIYWSGTYYHRCRFKDDELKTDRFTDLLWRAKQVEFVGCLGRLI